MRAIIELHERLNAAEAGEVQETMRLELERICNKYIRSPSTSQARQNLETEINTFLKHCAENKYTARQYYSRVEPLLVDQTYRGMKLYDYTRFDISFETEPRVTELPEAHWTDEPEWRDCARYRK